MSNKKNYLYPLALEKITSEKILKDKWFYCLRHRNDMREKTVIVKSRRKFSKAQGKDACKFHSTGLGCVLKAFFLSTGISAICSFERRLCN